ncbi:MAG: tyrosine-type recombinase/integrase [Clostridiaceae bacterium]|nr:tyrosine-type recombinase/integrase [Clostridiaceae bacterium]
MATIRERGGAYQIRVSLGYNMQGKQISKTMTYTPAPGMTKKQIEKEVNRQATLFEEKCKNGFVLDGSTRFADYALKWLEINEGNLAPKTYIRYNSLLDRINPAIGHIKLENLQAHHLQEFYNNLAEDGIINLKPKAAGKNLGEYLKKNKITKADISSKTKIATSTIKAACDGKNILLEKAEAIAKALGVNFSDVFTVCNNNGAGLSEKSILHHHRLISVILGSAYKQGYVFRNVSTLATPPKVKQKDVDFLDEKEALSLCEALRGAPIKWKTALLLLLYTGMRRGELVGLEWSDIDFKSNLIHIKRTVQYVVGTKYEYTDENGVFHKGRLIEKEPKTKSSIRYISVDDGVMYLLNDYKKWWLEQKLLNGDRWVKTNKIFIKENGGVMHPDSITEYTKKFVKQNNLPHFTPHSLRHTNISIMIANGVDIKTVSARAGHSNITTTGNIYTHQIQSANAKAADKIGNIFSKIQKEKQA